MGLFQKFQPPGKKQEYKAEILQHLSDLLNTKRGFGAWQKTLGLESYTYGKSPKEIVHTIIKDIKYNIEHYEKRIQLQDIRFIPKNDLFYFTFQIQCKIIDHTHCVYVDFHHQKETFNVKMEP